MKKTRLDDSIALLLANISRHTGQGVLFYDRETRSFRTEGTLPEFCRHCMGDAGLKAKCLAVYEEAAKNALDTAEPFHYACWAGLLFAAVAVAPHTRCIGCVAVGGFRSASDSGNRLCDTDLPEKPDLPDRELTAKLLSAAPPISTAQLRGIGAYLQDASFASGLNSAEYFRRRHEVYLQQRAIAEHLQRMGSAAIKAATLVRRADALVDGVARARTEQLRRQCSAYLAMVLRACNWDIVRLKAHLRVPLALLTRNAILRGDDRSAVVRAELRFATRMDQAGRIEDVCHLFHEIISDFALRSTQPAVLTQVLSEKVARWLEGNYQKSATMEEASHYVGASVPSITKHIRHDTGKTFHELLLEIRIAEAKRLLASTELDLSAIAQQCGFCDQSHFTRNFRKAINLTPGQFRILMTVSEEDIRVKKYR